MNDHLSPIILTRDDHADHILGFWRMRSLDTLIDDILYDEVQRQVALAMAEPQPRPIDWTIARDWAAALALNFGGLGFGALIIWECLRP